MDVNFLGGLVARHIIDMSDAREMARALAYDLVKETYKLDGTSPRGEAADVAAAGAVR